MNCKGVIREISNYIDGELDAGIQLEIQRHLSDCQDCQLVVDQTRKTVALFCDSAPVALPEDVAARLHSALKRNYGGSGQ